MFWNVRAYFYLDREANEGKGYKDCKFIIVEKQDANNTKLVVPQRSTLSKDLSFYKCADCCCNPF